MSVVKFAFYVSRRSLWEEKNSKKIMIGLKHWAKNIYDFERKNLGKVVKTAFNLSRGTIWVLKYTWTCSPEEFVIKSWKCVSLNISLEETEKRSQCRCNIPKMEVLHCRQKIHVIIASLQSPKKCKRNHPVSFERIQEKMLSWRNILTKPLMKSVLLQIRLFLSRE